MLQEPFPPMQAQAGGTPPPLPGATWGISLLPPQSRGPGGDVPNGARSQAVPIPAGHSLQQLAREVLAQTREPAAHELCRALLAQEAQGNMVPVVFPMQQPPQGPAVGGQSHDVAQGSVNGASQHHWMRGPAPNYEPFVDMQRCPQSGAAYHAQPPEAQRYYSEQGGSFAEGPYGRPGAVPLMPHMEACDVGVSHGFCEGGPGPIVPSGPEDPTAMFSGFGGHAGFAAGRQLYGGGAEGRKARGPGAGGGAGREWGSNRSCYSASPSTCTTTTGGESSLGSQRNAARRQQQPQFRRGAVGGHAPHEAPRRASDPGSRRGHPADECDSADPRADTMKAQLQALQHENPYCVFITRRINKLGFSSSEQLRGYFSKYGVVKNIYVSHSRVKSMRHFRNRRIPSVHWRVRAAALGFVVMDTTKATSDVFRDGSEHLVGGVLIKVQPFHQRSSRDDEDDDGDDDGQTLDLLTDDEGWEDSPSFTTTLQDDADAAPPAAPPSTFQGSRTSAERGFRAALLRDRGERLDGCGVRAAAANRGRFARASSPTGFAAANRADAPKTGAGLLERYFGQAGPVHGEGGGNAALAAYSGFDQGGRDRMQGPGEQRPNQRRAAAADHPETQPWDLWQYFSEADLCQAMPDHYRD